MDIPLFLHPGRKQKEACATHERYLSSPILSERETLLGRKIALLDSIQQARANCLQLVERVR
jgi:hypothetical protein